MKIYYLNKIKHPNYKGHEMVVKEIMKWFPKLNNSGFRYQDSGVRIDGSEISAGQNLNTET